MTDDRVRTHVITKDGVLDFQHYFVKARCSPHISGFVFEGASGAQPCPEILAAIGSARLRTIVICPSNPFISIDPILAVPGMRAALAACSAPVVCVSPIIGGRAVKGPTAKMMKELGLNADALSIAQHYNGLIDAFVVDTVDAAIASKVGFPVDVQPIVMVNETDRDELARAVLRFADRLARPTGRRGLGGAA